MNGPLQAPFPYFGGKSTIASLVWDALGDVKHYLEPFFGSGAVLLARPNFKARDHIETVCDSDGFLANVWRSLQFSPDETARWCDWPVNHADLSARRRALIKNEKRLLENLVDDEKWHDPIIAGYWIWATSCWIGSGLISPGKFWQRPHLCNGGAGIHKLSGQIPHLTKSHRINKLSVILTSPNLEYDVRDPYNTNIYSWFRRLSERLRYVRVVCRDWSRVCGGDWQANSGTAGIFFDPPYGVLDRNTELYHHDSTTVAADVLAWCIKRGPQPDHRIVLAGYDEHDILESHGWWHQPWKGRGGYTNTGKAKNQNCKREKLWFSPHCQKMDLFQKVLS